MKKKSELLSVISKNWFYYLLWAVLAVFLWGSVFSYLTKPKKGETVYVFIGAESARTDIMQADLEAVKPDYIHTIDIYCFPSRMDGFASVFATRGQSQADVYILPEEYCEPSVMTSFFYPMDLAAVKEIFGEDADCDKTTYEGKVYGVKVYDKESEIGRATPYLTYAYPDDKGEKNAVGDYYLFFCKKSLHLGRISGSDLCGAVDIAQAIYNKKAE